MHSKLQGADLSLAAGRDLAVIAAEDGCASFMWNEHATFSSAAVTQLGSDLSTGGNLSLMAGRDLTLAAAADMSHREYYYKSHSKKIDAETLMVRQQATELEAGGNIVLGAGRDLTLVASAASAGEEVIISLLFL